MSKAFAAHLDAIRPGSPEAERLGAAATSAAGLLAYSQESGLDLSPEEAEQLASLTARPLSDGEIEGVAGGIYNMEHVFDLLKRSMALKADDRPTSSS